MSIGKYKGDAQITSGITSPFVSPVRRLVQRAAFFVAYWTRLERSQEKCDGLAENQSGDIFMITAIS
jgi:hypothetical protein